MARSSLSIVFVLLITGVLLGQSGAALQGRVFDPSGAVLRGATISVRNSSTGFDRSVATDGEGRYHVDGIPARTYDVTVAANGFRSAVIAALRSEERRVGKGGRAWRASAHC